MLPRPLPRAKLIWVTVIAVPSVLDWWASIGAADSDTLSETVRDTLARIPFGKEVFCVGWGGLSLWIVPHILRGLDERIEALKLPQV